MKACLPWRRFAEVRHGANRHANLSCRPNSTGLQDLKEALQAKYKIPILMLHCDMEDPRAYAEGPIQTRIDGFVELMEEKKRRAGCPA